MVKQFHILFLTTLCFVQSNAYMQSDVLYDEQKQEICYQVTYDASMYEKYLAFEEFLKTDAGQECRTLVTAIEKDMLRIFLVLTSVVETAVHNASEVIDEYKNNHVPMSRWYADLVLLVPEADCIFNILSNSLENTDENPTDAFKNNLEIAIAFLDCFPSKCDSQEASLLKIDKIFRDKIFEGFDRNFAQTSPLFQYVFKELVTDLKGEILELRQILHRAFEHTIHFLDIIDNEDVGICLLNIRAINITSVLNQRAQQLQAKYAAVALAHKRLDEVTAEDLPVLFEISFESIQDAKKTLRELIQDREQ